MTSTSAYLMDWKHPQVSCDLYYVTMEGILESTVSSSYDSGLTVAGTGELFIDGVLEVDNKTKQRQGTSFFGIRTPEEPGSKHLDAGKQYHVLVEYGTAPTSNLKLYGVISFGPGGLQRVDRKQAIQNAVELAADADQVVVCIGLSGEWQSGGFDRPYMDPPPLSDELVQRVLPVQPNTFIVV